jgi:hypothetical protein
VFECLWHGINVVLVVVVVAAVGDDDVSLHDLDAFSPRVGAQVPQELLMSLQQDKQNTPLNLTFKFKCLFSSAPYFTQRKKRNRRHDYTETSMHQGRGRSKVQSYNREE